MPAADTKPEDTSKDDEEFPGLTKAEESVLESGDFKENFDRAAFEQILEMDDDREREFSKEITYDFFTQADNAFKDMENGLKNKDLQKLSSLGHYLKGSSATLGMTKVKDSCEKIQHLGARKNEDGSDERIQEDDQYLDKIRIQVQNAKDEFSIAEKVLRRFYGDA